MRASLYLVRGSLAGRRVVLTIAAYTYEAAIRLAQGRGLSGFVSVSLL